MTRKTGYAGWLGLWVGLALLSLCPTGAGAAGRFEGGHSDDPLRRSERLATDEMRQVMLEPPVGMDFHAWRGDLRKSGLDLHHAFPPAGGLLALPEGEIGVLRMAVPFGTTIHEECPEGEAREGLLATDAGRVLLHAFRRLSGLDEAPDANALPGLPLDHDALVPPVTGRSPLLSTCNATQLKRTTSEYLLGSVSINLILPESNGAIDTQTENWDSSRENTVTNEVVEAMNDLRGLYAARGLVSSLQPSFTYHIYFGRTDSRAATSYEPITRKADPNNDPGTGEGLWVRQILSNFGYSTALSKWDMGLEFNGDTRFSDGADWAFTIFVADSNNDSDGMFTDGYFAYAWLAGPYVVMTYDNDNWGYSQMNKVGRHETCHIFHALDEYASSPCTCTEVSGYINYPNQNCNKTCLINQNCIMNEANRQTGMCAYTAGQIGWGDADADAIPDPVDIAPDTAFATYAPNPSYSGRLLPTGTAGVVARPSQSVYGYGCDMNILDIAGVSWRVNGGIWGPASPLDGIFDGPLESFYFNTSMAPGIHFFEARSTDVLSQVDASAASTWIQVLGLPGVPDGTGQGVAMRSTKLDPAGGSVQVTWDQGTCAPPGNHLVAGYGSGLPAVPGGVYLPSLPGSYCSLGTVGTIVIPVPYDPAADSTRFIWWLMVPDGGLSQSWVEGSWGKDSSLLERAGPGLWGESGLCGTSDKDTGVPCGH